jgi:hypothetical protein
MRQLLVRLSLQPLLLELLHTIANIRVPNILLFLELLGQMGLFEVEIDRSLDAFLTKLGFKRREARDSPLDILVFLIDEIIVPQTIPAQFRADGSFVPGRHAPDGAADARHVQQHPADPAHLRDDRGNRARS